MNFSIENTIVYLPENEIEDDTKELLLKMSKSPVLQNIRVMPDCHHSSYCCVGMTSLIHDKIIPQLLGGDIGCGILTYNLQKNIKEKHYKKIDSFIKEHIPMGDKSHLESIINQNVLNNLYQNCNTKLPYLRSKFPNIDPNFQFNEEYFQNLHTKLQGFPFHNAVSNLFTKSLGTLGGGNHYIEFNKELSSGNCYLTIHSGSRYLGQAICTFHQNKIYNQKTYHKKTFLNHYLQDSEMIEYLIDMIFAQEFAAYNRRCILQIILHELGVEYTEKQIIESIHNYIDFQRMILRKGAISAEKDQICILSLTMADGILLCKGKGNSEWNYSCAHGCGRILNRKEATKQYNIKDFQKSMKHVFSSCIVKETLDEIPFAYKNINLIKSCIHDSVDILQQLIPIMNIKGF